MHHTSALSLFAVAIVAAAPWLQPLSAQAQNLQAQDALVVDMGAAFRKNDKRALSAALPRMQGHPLESWAAYWELKARLDEASPQEVQLFLQRWQGSYLEDRLRAEWLLLLGQRREWSSFAAEYGNYRMRDERELACYAAHIEQVKSGQLGSEQVELVRQNLFANRDADDGCITAAANLLAAGKLKTDDFWREARLSVEANRIRAASKALEVVAPEAVAALGEVATNPARHLARNSRLNGRTSKELVVLAVIRLAATQNDHAAALIALERVQGELSEEQRSYAYAVVAKEFNLSLEPQAHELFERANNAHLTDDLLQWKVRAALRAASGPQWRTVRQAVEAMSPAAQRESAWAYWRARALLAGQKRAKTASEPERPDVAEALRVLQGMASVRGFYEQLALEELGQRVVLPPPPPAVTDAEREAARLNPGLNRALYAIAIGLRSEGVREWNYSTNLHTAGGMLERELLAAAQFACEREVWDRCINTSERTKAAFDATQRFPMPFRDTVVRKSRDVALDPAYVYGLIRQESRFIMDARSVVGASGLMQLMPATARWTAKKIGLESFKASDVNDREVNIALGTAYLKLVLDDFGGSGPLASAAYNAGPGRPRAWRNGPTVEGAIWAENVPFLETRTYVKNVAANASVYAALMAGATGPLSPSLKSRLGQVGVRSDATAPENKELP